MPKPWSFLRLVLAASLGAMAVGPASAYDKAHAAPSAQRVDINVASPAELKTLPGIGDAQAAKIVAARPYMTKTGLVEKKVLTLKDYDALRSRIVVVHKRAPLKPKG